MERYEKIFMGFIAAVCAILIIAVFLLLFIGPIYEREHYTKLTGVEVSYFDAFFMNLDTSKHVIKIDKKVKK